MDGTGGLKRLEEGIRDVVEGREGGREGVACLRDWGSEYDG